MTNRRSRRLQEGRLDPFVGADEADITMLLERLNGESEELGVRAVRRLVRDMNYVDGISRSHAFPEFSYFDIRFSPYASLRKRGYGAVAERLKRIRDCYENFAINTSPVFPDKSFWIFERRSPIMGRNETSGSVPWMALAVIHGLAMGGRLKQGTQVWNLRPLVLRLST